MPKFVTVSVQSYNNRRHEESNDQHYKFYEMGNPKKEYDVTIPADVREILVAKGVNLPIDSGIIRLVNRLCEDSRSYYVVSNKPLKDLFLPLAEVNDLLENSGQNRDDKKLAKYLTQIRELSEKPEIVKLKLEKEKTELKYLPQDLEEIVTLAEKTGLIPPKRGVASSRPEVSQLSV